MLTAEYGGTGGKAIEQGMVVEEPDIEIGAGVSSKGKTIPKILSIFPLAKVSTAISRRMQTDKGGQQGPRSERADNQRFRQPERNNRDNNQNNNNNNDSNQQQSNNNPNAAPAVPGFGFQFPGMPPNFQFPPGFIFPGATPAQPPPPGAS